MKSSRFLLFAYAALRCAAAYLVLWFVFNWLGLVLLADGHEEFGLLSRDVARTMAQGSFPALVLAVVSGLSAVAASFVKELAEAIRRSAKGATSRSGRPARQGYLRRFRRVKLRKLGRSVPRP